VHHAIVSPISYPKQCFVQAYGRTPTPSHLSDISKNGSLSIEQDQQQAVLPFPTGMAIKHAILRHALNALLPVIGIDRHFPCNIVHGHSAHFGLTTPQFYDSQGFLNLSALLKFGSSACPTGQLI